MDYNDLMHLCVAKNMYTQGEYFLSKQTILPIIEKHKNSPIINQDMCDLYVSYDNICNVFGEVNCLFDKMEHIFNNLSKIEVSREFHIFFHTIYCTSLLRQKRYNEAKNLLCYQNYINIPGINFLDMSFFKSIDKDKILFIYYSGGIGDYIMFGRIVHELCNTYKNNKIIWFISFSSLMWLFEKVFGHYTNLLLLNDQQIKYLKHFDYHCSLLQLYKNMNYTTYESIIFFPYLGKIRLNYYSKHEFFLERISKNKQYRKKIVLNWKGNPNNGHEKHNRGIQLQNMINLLEIKDICWIIVNKCISSDELEIFKKYKNVYILIHEIPNFDHPKSFYDTMIILKHVDCVISTDTSIVHIALTMGIQTYVLLTKGCEWRWTHDKITKWYPEAKLIRQKKMQDWSNVIQELKITILK